MRKHLFVILAIMCFYVTGCASKYMKPSENPVSVVEPVAQEESAIVFLRTTSFGGAIQAPVLEVKDGQLEFVAVLSAGAKFHHKTKPGKHLYLIDGEFGYFMDANLEGGKTYYVRVAPHMGWWQARFLFEPVTDKEVTQEKFKKDFDWCKWVENTPEGTDWFLSQKSKFEKRYTGLIQGSAAEGFRDAAKMRPEYGVTQPIQ